MKLGNTTHTANTRWVWVSLGVILVHFFLRYLHPPFLLTQLGHQSDLTLERFRQLERGRERERESERERISHNTLHTYHRNGYLKYNYGVLSTVNLPGSWYAWHIGMASMHACTCTCTQQVHAVGYLYMNTTRMHVLLHRTWSENGKQPDMTKQTP